MVTKTQAVSPNADVTITTRQLMLAFSGLFLLNLLLRVFYLRYDFVNGDEGVRALTAVRMLEGARLYADVVTDKPPGASLFYAAVFALFGRSMKAVHLVAIVWNFGTGVVVYAIATRFYDRRIGLWAALLFVYFSTNYFTQDMMAANTELLMALPYAAAFYCFTAGRAVYDGKGDPKAARAALIAAGLLTGLATMFKQVGVLNLAFFALYEVLTAWSGKHQMIRSSLMSWIRRVFANLWPLAVGFTLIIAAFLLWLRSMDALGDFWKNGIILNMFYTSAEPASLWIKFMIGRGLGYLFFNAALCSLAAWTVWRAIRKVNRDKKALIDERAQPQLARFDLAIAFWCAVSLAGVIMSGRFFGHYFIPALPALSLLAARGVQILGQSLREPSSRRRAQLGLAILGLFFSIGLFRSHHRTAVLAYETVTGTRTRWSGNWGMTKREQEAEVVSEFVREKIPAGEPLYIWGYAHDVFWRTGCRPASRYLTPSYIDGRFPDAEATVPTSGAEFRHEAAANLLEDLGRTRPLLILDAGGGFKTLPYPDLVGFIDDNYRAEGSVVPEDPQGFRVLKLKSEEEKRREEVERQRRREIKRQRSGL